MSEIISRDQNFRTVGAAVTNDVAQDITMLRTDPVTDYLLIDITIDTATAGNSIPIAQRDQNFRPVCLAYDESNDVLCEVLTDSNGYLLADIEVIS